MNDATNPVIPGGYDIVWSTVAVIVIALTVIALITLIRAAKRLPASHALIWVLIVLFVPVLGPVAWLMIGRRAKPAGYTS